MIWARTSRHAQSRRIVPVFWGISGWKSAICTVDLDLFIERTPRRMSNVDDPDVGVLDEIVDTIWVSRDEPAAQFRGFGVTNAEIGPGSNKSRGVKNCSPDALGGSRVFLGDVFQNFPKIVACAR